MRISETIKSLGKPAALITALAVLYCITPIHNGNIFWHLRNGLDILETGEIRTEDPFTWTRQGVCWIQHEWLAEVAMASSWIHFGESGPVFLKAFFIGLSVLLAYKAAVRNGGDPGFVFIFAALWLSLAQPRWIARPHFFSIFFFSVYLYILSLRIKCWWKYTLILLPVQILWVNVHAGFVMGVFLASLPAMDLLFNGKFKELPIWVLPPVVLLLASGIHPNGFRTLEYLPSFLAQPLYKESIREWWSPFDARYAPDSPVSKTAVLLVSLTLFTALVLSFYRKTIEKGKTAALMILTAATVFAARNGELLAPAMLAWVPGMTRLKTPGKAILPVFILLAAVPFVYGIPREIGPPRHPGGGVDWSVYPVPLADLLEENPELMENSTLFNTNEISGYLQFRFGERLPLFMDGRCLLFPEGFHLDYLILSVAPDNSFQDRQYELFRRYDFNLLLYNSWDNSSSAHLAAILPDYRPIHISGLSVAYASRDLLEQTGLTHLGFRYFDPLFPGEFLSTPLYLLPQEAVTELNAVQQHISFPALDAVTASLIYRADSTASLPDAAVGAMATHTLNCWAACRSGNLSDAEEHAVKAGDRQLLTAVRILQGEPLGSQDAVMGIHSGLISAPEDRIAAEITALWVTGQQQRALSMAEAMEDSLNSWAVAQCALLYSISGNQFRADELMHQALASSRSPYVLYRAAGVLKAEEDYETAIEYCRESLRLSPGFVEARLLLANCLWENCSISDAAMEYQRILDDGYSLPEHALKKLDLVVSIES